MPAVNAMSVDVEDWFQVQAFAGVVPREAWDGFTPRVEANTDRLLEQFGRAGIHATFFTLGWVAERQPALVRRITAAGHELASHGWGHQLVHEIGEAAFRTDVRRAKRLLEDTAGVAVTGYRAPTFSIGPRTPWAHQVLAEEGYGYSSSVFPIRHDLYGTPDAPVTPHLPHPDGVTEVPMTIVRALGRNLPCSGGGWFRLVPYPVFRTGLRQVNREGRPGVFYFHPWEVDPGQPRLRQAGRLSRFRHTVGLDAMTGAVGAAAARLRLGADGRRVRPSRPGGKLSMAVKVRALDTATEPAWDAFVQAQSEATFFHLSPWRHVIAGAFGHATHYAVAEQDGAVVGVLPLARMRTLLFGDLLASTPFCVYGGPVAATPEAAAALEVHARDLHRSTGAACLEFREREAPDPAWLEAGWTVRPPLYWTFRKPITGNPDADMKAIPRKQRAMVRKGLQNGLTSVSDRDTNTLHRVYAESVRNLGSPVFPRRYFRMLGEAFPDAHDVTTVLHEGRPVASVLNFHFRQEVLPYYGGGVAAARALAANDVLYWEVMRRAGAERGARLFDFGRSKSDTGAMAFKRNWGFEAQPLHYCYRLRPGARLPENNPKNPKYAAFIAAWRRLPLPLANVLGPPLVRGLG